MVTEISPEEAAREFLTRKEARDRLISFITYTKPDYIVEPVHHYICSILERFREGRIKRLILTGPPRVGKSEIVSVRFPAWAIGKNPKDDIIVASYGADLAAAKTKECRDIVESKEYQSIFPDVGTQDDSRAGNEWHAKWKDHTTPDVEHQLSYTWRKGSHVLATGVAGGATGFGAEIFIVDDYLKNMKDAQSAIIKQDQIDWYKSVVTTRDGPTNRTLIMATRWVEDDLIGRLLKEATEEWVVIRLPAIAETQAARDYKNKKIGLPAGLPDPLKRNPGEPISPTRYGLNYYKSKLAVQGSSYFEAMYQGSPTIAEGNRFKRAFFKTIKREELQDQQLKDILRVRYWDKAATEDGGCFTAGVLIAYYRKLKKYVIEDVKKEQYSTTRREQLIKRVADNDAVLYNNTVETWVEQEPGSGGKDSAQITVDNLSGHKVFVEKVTGSKDVRLEQFLAQLEFGNVLLVEAEWNEDLIEEFIQIPNGQFRDQSDATGGGFNKLVLARGTKTVTSPAIVAKR